MSEELLSIVYVSAATRLMDDEELERLLQEARRNNLRLDVSGLLLYGDGNFMQLLEGPEAVVRELYARICRDPRHHMVTTVFDESGLAREFSDWSMAYRRVDAPTWLRLSHLARGDGQAAGNSMLKGLLASFWQSVA